MGKVARDGPSGVLLLDKTAGFSSTQALARAVVEALDVGATGILHLTNSGECSWYEFAQATFDIAGLKGDVSLAGAHPDDRHAAR